MLYVTLSILTSALLIVIFKLFDRFQINTFQGILFNYFTCVACAWVTMGQFPIPTDVVVRPWFPYALVLGFCFITGFNAVGGTVRNFSLALGSVMQKMSLLFAVAFMIIYYREPFTWYKVLGVLAAIGAIILTSFTGQKSVSNTENQTQSLRNWVIFPFAAWILSGVIDILLYYVEREINGGKTDISFIASLFGTAGIIGTAVFVYGLFKGTMTFSFRNVIAGICLGIPNFASIYFLLRSFNVGFEGASVLTITNVGIICLSTLFGFLFFSEPLHRGKLVGIGLAVVAVLLIGFGQML